MDYVIEMKTHEKQNGNFAKNLVSRLAFAFGQALSFIITGNPQKHLVNHSHFLSVELAANKLYYFKESYPKGIKKGKASEYIQERVHPCFESGSKRKPRTVNVKYVKYVK